jgi:predicted branched-subunit amino acid permease
MASMKQAMRATSTVIALVFVGIAIYVGFSGSWSIAILLFLFAGGVEFMAYALGANPSPRSDDERNP